MTSALVDQPLGLVGCPPARRIATGPVDPTTATSVHAHDSGYILPATSTGVKRRQIEMSAPPAAAGCHGGVGEVDQERRLACSVARCLGLCACTDIAGREVRRRRRARCRPRAQLLVWNLSAIINAVPGLYLMEIGAGGGRANVRSCEPSRSAGGMTSSDPRAVRREGLT